MFNLIDFKKQNGFILINPEKIKFINNPGYYCQLPYPNHPKGCPNFGKKDICPPKAPKFEEYINLNKPIYISYSEFDLNQHREKMKLLHSNWSNLQLNCVLYWQSKSRKQMMDRAKIIKKQINADIILTCPEAMGVNVFATCLKNGLKLEKTKNINICHHIGVVGFLK